MQAEKCLMCILFILPQNVRTEVIIFVCVHRVFCIIPSNSKIPPEAMRRDPPLKPPPRARCSNGSLQNEINGMCRMPTLLKCISGRGEGFYNYRRVGDFGTWHQLL